MTNIKSDKEQPKRRFCKAKFEAIIMEHYAKMPTADLAEELGLTGKQIENYVYRNNSESWARKQSSVLSMVNSEKGKKGGRPPK